MLYRAILFAVVAAAIANRNKVKIQRTDNGPNFFSAVSTPRIEDPVFVPQLKGSLEFRNGEVFGLICSMDLVKYDVYDLSLPFWLKLNSGQWQIITSQKKITFLNNVTHHVYEDILQVRDLQVKDTGTYACSTRRRHSNYFETYMFTVDWYSFSNKYFVRSLGSSRHPHTDPTGPSHHVKLVSPSLGRLRKIKGNRVILTCSLLLENKIYSFIPIPVWSRKPLPAESDKITNQENKYGYWVKRTANEYRSNLMIHCIDPSDIGLYYCGIKGESNSQVIQFNITGGPYAGRNNYRYTTKSMVI